MALLVVNAAVAATLEMTCTTPTEREDGTRLDKSEISHFNVYLNGELTGRTAGNECAYSGPISGGEYDLTATTVDTNGLESAHSDPVSLVAPNAKPKPPTLLQIISEWFANLWRMLTGKPQVSVS